MRLPANLLPFIAVLLLSLVVVACGEGGDESSESTGSNSSSETTKSEAPEIDDDAPPAKAGDPRVEGASTFVLTPELSSCMTAAGFSSDAPTHGSLAAWRHENGARVLVATDSGAALEVAGQVGTDKLPANVDGATVTAGSPEQVGAVVECLAD